MISDKDVNCHACGEVVEDGEDYWLADAVTNSSGVPIDSTQSSRIPVCDDCMVDVTTPDPMSDWTIYRCSSCQYEEPRREEPQLGGNECPQCETGMTAIAGTTPQQAEHHPNYGEYTPEIPDECFGIVRQINPNGREAKVVLEDSSVVWCCLGPRPGCIEIIEDSGVEYAKIIEEDDEDG